MFTKYHVKLQLLTMQLGTNSLSPSVREKHIIGKQNELIEKFNKCIGVGNSKYKDAKKITSEEAKQEIDATFRKLEEYIGRTLSDEEREEVLLNPKDFFKRVKEDEPTGITGFFYDEEKKLPYIHGYMITGFLKSAGEALARIAEVDGSKGKKGEFLSSISQTKSLINQYVSCDRFIYFNKDIARNPDGTAKLYERPLRGMTPQGPRVALSSSEYVEAGAYLEFDMRILEGVITGKDIEKLLEYGELKGLGQFRNGDHGQFKVIHFKKMQ